MLDIAFNPFNDNIIASTSEDTVIRLWEIPDAGLTKNLTEPLLELIGHQRRCGFLLWHPTAENVLLSAGTDCKVFLWNVGTASIITCIELPDLIFHCSFNWNGSKLVVSCKDKKIRVFDPRTGELEQEGKGHEGAKPQKAIYLRNGKIFTTGFSRSSERQYSLRSEDILGDPIVMEIVDTSNGVLFPFYDPDTNLLYLCAKVSASLMAVHRICLIILSSISLFAQGDCTIKYYEITDEAPYVHYINTYQSSEPQRGIGHMPKRGCDIKNCEIGRFFKLHSKGLCEVISFTVPRKSDLFQEDIYPDTASSIPALTADEWASGIDREPVLISLKNGSLSSATSGAPVGSAPFKKPDAIKPANSSHTNGIGKAKPPVLEKSKLSGGSVNSKIANFQLPKESPPVTPSSLTSNNSHSYPSSNSNHTNGNSHSGQPAGAQLTDLVEELKMMKGIIIKHENRIRELEKKLVDQSNKGTNHYSKPALKGYHDSAGFLPDEV